MGGVKSRNEQSSATDMLGGSCSSPRRPLEGTRGKASEGSPIGAPGARWPGWQVAPCLGASLPRQEAHRREGGTQEPQHAGGTEEGPWQCPCGWALLSWDHQLERKGT